ncbi:MAG: nitroreductase family protein [Anaerostipes sp.]|jgi:nitroreductase|nr:nitroreductase family protein [Anaerostipes sp.]
MQITKLMRIIGNDVLADLHAYMIEKSKKYDENRFQAFVLRNVHSIEKGLSLENPRAGFGFEKIHELMEQIDFYLSMGGTKNSTHIHMAIDAIQEYLDYHKMINYTDSNIEQISKEYNHLKCKSPVYTEKKGGIRFIHRKNWSQEEKNRFKNLIQSRHSIRQFSGENVDIDDLKEAINLAFYAPSACNRQAVRTYILSKEKKQEVGDWLDGVGGFANDVDTYVIVTGKQSYYYLSEHRQYIVSASIAIGYLTLTLEMFSIGACVLQRPVVYSKKWNEFKKKMNIPDDEQVIAFLGCGMLKEDYKVPISNRLKFDEIGRVL